VPERSHWRVRPRATKTPDDDRSLSPLRARAWAHIIRVHAAAEFVAHAVDRGESYTREGRTSTVGGFNGRCRMVVACARTWLMSLRRIASTSIHYVVIIVSVSLIILIRRVAFDVCITASSRGTVDGQSFICIKIPILAYHLPTLTHQYIAKTYVKNYCIKFY